MYKLDTINILNVSKYFLHSFQGSKSSNNEPNYLIFESIQKKNFLTSRKMPTQKYLETKKKLFLKHLKEKALASRC